MNRTVGLTLRRTAEAGVIFTLGFGALSVAPHDVVPVAASTTVPSFDTTTVARSDDLPPRNRPIAELLPIVEPSPIAAPYAVPVAAPAPKPSDPRPPVQQLRSIPAIAPAAAAPVRRSARPADAAAFYYGYCTWWVAQKRDIPWRGDAAQWWWNARAFGFAEGPSPRVGAIMVMASGGSASSVGHVAYVEKVNANGTFVVSEMNWWGVPGGGWGRVDYRTVTSMRGILGFIY